MPMVIGVLPATNLETSFLAIEDCQKAAELYLEQEKTKDYQYAMKILEKLQR